MNRRLPNAINAAAREDLFKHGNCVGRPRFIVVEAQKFCKKLITELLESEILDSRGNDATDAWIKERVSAWLLKVKGDVARLTSTVEEVLVAFCITNNIILTLSVPDIPLQFFFIAL